tara:strand:- start:32 stop:577 length:546 start_codon:yes stop_codon:yes gene_type:complete
MDMVELPVLPVWGVPANPELGVEVSLPTLELSIPRGRGLILPSAKQMRQQIQAEQEELDEQKQETLQRLKPKKPQGIQQVPDVPQFKEVTEFTLPGTDISIPVPRKEILSTAIVTAGASSVAAVAGTLVASTLLKRLVQLLKPVMKIGMKRLAKVRGRPAPETFGRQRLRQRRNKENPAGS